MPVLVGGSSPGWVSCRPRGGSAQVAEAFGGEEKRFLLTWFGFILVFFSISSSSSCPM
jgi:hypothetical protein